MVDSMEVIREVRKALWESFEEFERKILSCSWRSRSVAAMSAGVGTALGLLCVRASVEAVSICES